MLLLGPIIKDVLVAIKAVHPPVHIDPLELPLIVSLYCAVKYWMLSDRIF